MNFVISFWMGFLVCFCLYGIVETASRASETVASDPETSEISVSEVPLLPGTPEFLVIEEICIPLVPQEIWVAEPEEISEPEVHPVQSQLLEKLRTGTISSEEMVFLGKICGVKNPHSYKKASSLLKKIESLGF